MIVLNCSKSIFVRSRVNSPFPEGHNGQRKLHKLVGSIWTITGLPQVCALRVRSEKPRLELILIKLINCDIDLGMKGEIGFAGGRLPKGLIPV